MLTERRRKLLQFIIDEYVDSAQPVASQTVVRKYRLPLSPATIRNEMVRLEEEGYIAQPHTSAGRVPSDKGYRYYVETLMPLEEPPPHVQRTIRHQFHQAARQMEEWARLAASILAARLHNAAVVTPPHARQHRLRWLELVSLHDFLALLILVMQEARVLQRTLALDQPLSQDDLTRVARHLTDLFSGLTAEEMRRQRVELSPLEARVAQAAADLLAAEDAAAFEPAFLEGLRELLHQPEFQESERILSLLELLEERNLPRAIPVEMALEDDITIVIGREHPNAAMHLCSVIIARYSGPLGLRGTLSIVGPTRMHYPKAVSMIRYVASILEELLSAHFA